MQASELLQIALAAIGLAGVAWVRVSFMRRLRVDASVAAYDARERAIRMAAWALIAVALLLVFFPF